MGRQQRSAATVSPPCTLRVGCVAALAATVTVCAAAVAAPLGLFDLHPSSLGTAAALAVVSPGATAAVLNCAAVPQEPGLHVEATAGSRLGTDVLLAFSGTLAGRGPGTLLWAVTGGSTYLKATAGGAAPLGSRGSVGGAFAYDSDPLHGGGSFSLGLHVSGRVLELGMCVRRLGASLLGDGGPVAFDVAALLTATPRFALGFAAQMDKTSREVAFGAQASIWSALLRWGMSLDTGGSITGAGIGLGLTPLGVPVNVALGLVGTSLAPCASISSSLASAPWW